MLKRISFSVLIMVHASLMGQYWDTVFIDSEQISDITFANPQHGFAIVGKVGIVLTNDSGKSWNRLYIESPPAQHLFRSIAAINKDTFVVCGNKIMFQTFDGGGKWNITYPAASFFNTVFLAETGEALCGGFNGEIFRSADYGKTWVKEFSKPNYTVNKIRCFSNGVCLAALTNAFILWKNIHDTIWKEIPPVTAYGNFRDITAINDSVFYALDDGFGPEYNQALHITYDTGRTWKRKELKYNFGKIPSKQFMQFFTKDSGVFYGTGFELHKITHIDSPLTIREVLFNAELMSAIYMFDFYKGFGTWNDGTYYYTTGIFSNKVKRQKPTPVVRLHADNIKIYPNPFKEQLTIERPLIEDTSLIDIYNLYGTCVYTAQLPQSDFIADLDTLDQGNYILVIRTPQGQQILKTLITKL